MKKYFLLLVITSFLIKPNFAQPNWQNIVTVKDICAAYPDQMKKMLDQFNLDYPGLEKVKKAYEKGDLEKACSALLDYYKSGNTAEYLRKEQPAKTNQTTADADTILEKCIYHSECKRYSSVLAKWPSRLVLQRPEHR